MQTDPDIIYTPSFDADTARELSLRATLSRVKVCRRVRRAGRAAVAVACAALAVRLAMPSGGVVPEETGRENPIIVRTVPLTQEQKVMTVKSPALFVRNSGEVAAALRVSTPADRLLPRLGEDEFRHWLAVYEVGSIQVGTGPVQVLPLHQD